MHSPNLENTLQRALALASEHRHTHSTLEHLLLAMTDDPDAVAVLRACSVAVERLRSDLKEFLEKDLAGLALAGEEKVDAKPTAGFQRIIQRADTHVKSAGRDEVTGVHVLVALFSERESHAVYFLQLQDMNRLDAVNYISHGITKPSANRRVVAPVESGPKAEAADSGSSTANTQKETKSIITSNLENTIQRALAFATERRHELCTPEHLLMAMMDDPDAVAVLRACKVYVGRLRPDLEEFLDKDLAGLAVQGEEKVDAKPTAAFQRIVQRAAIHVQSSGRDEVTSANVLIALFSERESHAVYFLQLQEMTRADAINYIYHGIAKEANRGRIKLPPRPNPWPKGADEIREKTASTMRPSDSMPSTTKRSATTSRPQAAADEVREKTVSAKRAPDLAPTTSLINVETKRSITSRPQAARLQAIIAERRRARYLRGISAPR